MFVTGLTGGFGHCIGMCGPVVAAYSVSLGRGSILPHLLYNLGRITTYVILGGIMGFTGSFVILAGRFQDIQKTIMIIAGMVIIGMGLGMAGILPIITRVERKLSALPMLQKVMRVFSGDITTGTYYPMGIALGFIPCGLVYTALLSSARLGMEASTHITGLLNGALLMMLFGIGTMPALLLFGKIVNIIGIKLREQLYRVSAVIMIVMGIIFILRTVRV